MHSFLIVYFDKDGSDMVLILLKPSLLFLIPETIIIIGGHVQLIKKIGLEER